MPVRGLDPSGLHGVPGPNGTLGPGTGPSPPSLPTFFDIFPPPPPPPKKPCPCWGPSDVSGATSCDKTEENLCRATWAWSGGKLGPISNVAAGKVRCDVPMNGGGDVGVGKGPAQPFPGALCKCEFRCKALCKSTGACGKKGQVSLLDGGGCGTFLGTAAIDPVGGWTCVCPGKKGKCPDLCNQ